jgi:hypothetical protein
MSSVWDSRFLLPAHLGCGISTWQPLAMALCEKPEEGYEPGPFLRICPQLFADDRADRHADWALGSGALILIFTLNATMNLFGIMMELHNQHTEKTNWTAFIYGCIAGIVPWIVIMLYFVGAVNSGDAKPPPFVYAIVPTLFVFFNIFAINMVLQYKKVARGRITCSGSASISS